jgi:hypothetical protein
VTPAGIAIGILPIRDMPVPPKILVCPACKTGLYL